MNRFEIVHLTSVHRSNDPRVFRKECRAAAEAGFKTGLVVPLDDGDEAGEREGVVVVGVPRVRSRVLRMIVTTARVLREAMRSGARICHFHDPELIPAGLLLRIFGRRVVYDVHEDYVTSIAQKTYMPSGLARLVARAFDLAERGAARAFSVVLAERYYADRFPRGVQVLNHPRLEDLPGAAIVPPDPARPRVLYTGNIGRDRGSREHARLLSRHEGLEMTMIGRCGGPIADEIRTDAAGGAGRLTLVGEDGHVPYDVILEAYDAGGWTAGLALFPPTEHYLRKELTKFYEYMAAGIPVLCSDFPVWRDVVERERCGICVDTRDDAAVDRALQRLIDDPEEARAMGERGRRAVHERYHWGLQADKLVALYRSLAP